MRTGNDVQMDILSDEKVKLFEEFHRNFTRKAFFDKPWKPRRIERRGSLLLVSGKLRRSLKATVTHDGLRISSSMPYASAHNEGYEGNVSVRAHTRGAYKARRRVKGRTRQVDVRAHTVSSYTYKMSLPERRFVGDHPEVRRIVTDIVSKHLDQWGQELAAKMQRHARSTNNR